MSVSVLQPYPSGISNRTSYREGRYPVPYEKRQRKKVRRHDINREEKKGSKDEGSSTFSGDR